LRGFVGVFVGADSFQSINSMVDDLATIKGGSISEQTSSLYASMRSYVFPLELKYQEGIVLIARDEIDFFRKLDMEVSA
jgi:hypothetical protein